MQIEEIRFQLKDGRFAVLRSPRAEDAEGTLQYLAQSAGETEFILRYPEECGKYTLEGERALFEQQNASPNNAMIMCLVDGKIAGNCEIRFFAGMKTRHRARVGGHCHSERLLESGYWHPHVSGIDPAVGREAGPESDRIGICRGQ